MMYGYGFHRGLGACLGWGNGLMYGGWGMIIMLGLAVLAVAAFILLVKRVRRSQPDNAALDMLRMMLAKGEISEEEYIKRKTILS